MTQSQRIETPELPKTPTQLELPLEGGSEEVADAIDWTAVSSDENEEVKALETVPESDPVPLPEPIPEPEPPSAPAPAPTPIPEPAVEAPTVTPTIPPVAPPPDLAAEEARIREDLEKVYGLSEEEALAFQTEPELVLPKMAANLHMQITRDVLAGIQAIMPQLIQNVQHNSAAEMQARDIFYGVNPDLRDPKLEDAVIQCGKLFRQVNPEAPVDVAAKRIGDMVRQALGMPNPVSDNSTPAASAAVPQSAPKIVPFSPARGGANAPAVKPLSEWEKLALDDDD